MEEEDKKKKDKASEKNTGEKKSGKGGTKEHSRKEKKTSVNEKIKRRSETIEVIRNLSKSQHNDQYELRSLLNVKLGEISSILEKFSKNLDVKLEEEFISLKEVVQSVMDNLSDEVKNSPQKLQEKTEELQKTLAGKIEDSADVVSNGLTHIGEVFEKLEGSFKEEINALRETLQKVFEEMYMQFKESSEGLKEMSSLIKKYVEDFKGEREKFNKRKNKEEARRLNDMAVKNYYVGKVELAIRQLKEAVLLDETSPEILANLAVALSKDGKQKDARKIFEKILEENPDMVEAQVGMGLILFERGNIDEAIEIFKEASKKDEVEAFTYANLGYAYEQKDLIDKAVLSWEKAFELDPTLKDVGEKLKLYKDKEA
jgi:tetratricopeptide (TPR) repeat protein